MESKMARNILITGANAGLGKESARQFAQQEETEKIYLGVRNLQKGEQAKNELEQTTGRKIFELLEIDVSNIESARQAALSIEHPIDALVLNAGGIGGKTPLAKSKYGVINIVAQNLIGHVALVDELIANDKLKGVVIYAGSEGARGVKKFGIGRPELRTYSKEEYKSVLNGSFFGQKADPLNVYAYVKQIAALWIAAMARKHPDIRFVAVSPGATTGTDVSNDANIMFKFLMRTSPGKALGKALGLTHDLTVGAKRYVDVVNNDFFRSGVFYASDNPNAAIGKLSDQATIFEIFKNKSFQDNANAAIRSFLG